MVKADVRRDYYADLGLTPSAESEDIKKQFRKLALKFHPDRNPGRELEFISKFQAIQAAHEILSDPQQRLKYDTDRLRAGYGKLYGPAKPSAARKTATSNFASTPSPKPPTAKQQPFSARPQSFHTGPSSGAQRYASYARAAPKQPWEKTRDEGQTRADAYRGFQEMKGNGMPGWNQFDPRTGRSAFPGATPRPTAASAGQPRPKSAYEYFKTSPKPSTPEPARAQSTRKKQGFAPRAAAGGDEPMASSTSSYSNVYRGERSQTPNVFGTAPSPTARKAAAGFSSRADTLHTPEFERTSRQYASTGGERTFFSSTGFGRASSVRESAGSPKAYSRTNPPSPTPPESGRHRSASPKFKTDTARNYSSTSSSETDDDDIYPAHKPKAVPKSRLRPHQKFSGFHTQQQPGAAATSHEFDGTASPGNVFGARAQTPFESTQAPKTNNIPHNGTFKSSSHDDLRKPFSADSWGGFEFFKPKPSDQEPAPSPTRPDSRGRSATRNQNSPKPGSDSAGASTHDSSRSGSASQQKYPPFPEGKFRADDWVQKFSDMGWAMPKDDETKNPQQAANAQRQRSPRKPNARPAAKVRPTPQPATVATEAEEAQSTVNGGDKPEPAKTGSGDAEAMDLDDELPANTTATATNVEPEPVMDPKTETGPSQTQPAPNKPESAKESKLFNMKDLRDTAPFTATSNGGIDDLQDIHASLPFESRAKAARTTMNDIRPRKLACPNPPKRPQPPQLVPIGIGSDRLGLPRAAWERHVAEMEAYMRQWSAFNKQMIHHFVARQETLDTGMAPHWLGAVGDSTRVKINGENDSDGAAETPADDEEDRMVAGSGKGGFNAYMRGLNEDEEVQKRWEVAREMHKECMVNHGQLRDSLLNGSRLF